jgi:hypothetical protein
MGVDEEKRFMTLLSAAKIKLSVLILTCAMLPLGQAARWDKKTNLSVQETIEVPGATLTPGEYVVKLVDSDSNRHIVQFLNEDETEVLTTVIAIPNQRLEPTGDTTFTFYETPAGSTPALRAWFYPGDNFGQEFAYPKGRAQQLAKATNLKVPEAPDATMPQETVTAPPQRQEPVRETAAVSNAPAEQPAPRTAPVQPKVESGSEPVTLAQAQPPTAARPAPQRQQPTPSEPATQQPAEDRLPNTASPAPLFGLIGLGSFAAAMGLRRLSRL